MRGGASKDLAPLQKEMERPQQNEAHKMEGAAQEAATEIAMNPTGKGRTPTLVGHKCPTLEAEETAAIQVTVKQRVLTPVQPMPTQEGKHPVRGRRQGRGMEADA
jgi:hypothetical protein